MKDYNRNGLGYVEIGIPLRELKGLSLKSKSFHSRLGIPLRELKDRKLRHEAAEHEAQNPAQGVERFFMEPSP